MLSLPKASKLLLKANSKEKTQKTHNIKIPLPFFLNPIKSHRIYKDILIPDSVYSSKNPVYLFQEYLYYKSIGEVHLRALGLCFQFIDNDPEFITPLGLLQSRLNSLGNKAAHEMADLLPIYYSYFKKCEPFSSMNFSQEPIKSKNESIMTINSKLLSVIDSLFLENEGNVAFMTVTQRYKGLDDRLIMFGFSKECLGLMLFNEEDLGNVYENEFIEHCFKILTCYNYENRMDKLNVMLLRKEDDPKKIFEMQEINTIFGIINLEFCLKNIDIEIEGVKFVIFMSVLQEQEKDWVQEMMKTKKNFMRENGEGKQRKTNSDWGTLMNFYYPKILEEHSLENSKKIHLKNQIKD